MDGFQPRTPITVGLATEKIHQKKDFLEDHMDMLRQACQNVQKAQDRYKKYADDYHRNVTFDEGDQVFLRVPDHSQTLKTGLVPKLSPQFWGPFKVLKKVIQLAYKLELPETSRVHPIFHVSHLRKWLYNEDNVVDFGILVEYIEPPVHPHEPKKVLVFHESCLRQVLVKWKDRHDEGSTWENISTLKKRFPNFVFEDENSFEKGGVMSRHRSWGAWP